MRHALRIGLILMGLRFAAQDPGPILKDPATPTKPSTVAASKGPQLRIQHTAPATINLRKHLVVEIVVQNTGTDAAEQVRVEQELPDCVGLIKTEPAAEAKDRRVTWSLDTLRPGEERRLKLTLQGIAEGEFVGRPVVSHASKLTTTRLTKPLLALKQQEPKGAVTGEDVSLVIEVSNPGSGAASGVLLQHKLAPGLVHPRGGFLEKDVGALEPGEGRVIALPVKAVTRGKHISQVTAKGDDGLEAKLEAVMQVGEPELKVSQSSQRQRYINTEAIFTIEVTNPGDAPARQVEVQNALPAELRFESASDGGQFDKETRSVGWKLDSLAGGETRRLTMKVVPTRAASLKCVAAAKAEPKLEAHAEAALEVLGVPALLLEVVDADDPVAVGEETSYDIRVKNQGSASNTRVQIIVLLPDGLALVKADGATPHRLQRKQLIFEPLAELKAEAEVVYRVLMRGTIPGDYRLRVQLQSDQLRIPVCEEESTKVYRD